MRRRRSRSTGRCRAGSVGYSLRGLAEEGRCPECGELFDREARRWEEHGSSVTVEFTEEPTTAGDSSGGAYVHALVMVGLTIGSLVLIVKVLRAVEGRLDLGATLIGWVLLDGLLIVLYRELVVWWRRVDLASAGKRAAESRPPKNDPCPRCEYNLLGLPDKHRCPECGFTYERGRTWVIRQSKRFTRRSSPSSVSSAWSRMRSACRFGKSSLLGILLCAAVVLLTIMTLRRPSRHRAVLTPWGFSLFRKQELVQQFRWQQVGEVKYNPLGGGVSVIGTDGHKLHEIHAEFLGSRQRVNAFIAAAEECLARYRAARTE